MLTDAAGSDQTLRLVLTGTAKSVSDGVEKSADVMRVSDGRNISPPHLTYSGLNSSAQKLGRILKSTPSIFFFLRGTNEAGAGLPSRFRVGECVLGLQSAL